ncbi:MAG: ABC transporter ATP-binding protein [Dehalococcoidales bacterium]|nr:ABC transporter ATP-binding protein [Dehalococcoidales bacterium]
MNAQPVIETTDLTKVYDSVTAVDKLNLRIGAGEIFGFLGPNGAGKTTTILMLLGLTEPTSGVARVADFNSTREPLKVKRVAGYIPEKVGFYEDLTAYYNLAYTARLNGLSEELVMKRVGEALDMVGLSSKANQPVSTMSRGMKQRLALGDILVKTPRVAFMDEPTSGIDPKGVNEILDLIAKVAKEQGMTIVMSSHQLALVQRICTRVGIMIKGKMVAEGSVAQLGRDAISGGRYLIEIQLVEITSLLIDAIKRISGVTDVDRTGDMLVVTSGKDLRPQIAKAIVENNGLLVRMNIQSYGLEDIYMRYFREV